MRIIRNLLALLLCVSFGSHCFGKLYPSPKNFAGNVDVYGYARISTPPVPVKFGITAQSLYFEFYTDPARSPGIMGAYWHIPLLSSQASRIDPAMLKWLAPNGLTYFFQKKSRADLASNKAAARKIESEKLEFGISTSGKWLAYFDNSLGYLRIEDINNPDCYFLYKNGRLVRFSEKKGKEFDLEYSKNRISALRNASKRTVMASFEYHPDGLLKSVSADNGTYTFEYHDRTGSGMLESMGVELEGIKLLKRITCPDGSEYGFAYSAEKPRPRTIGTNDLAERYTAPVKVNRMAGTSESGFNGWIEWDAGSGFAMADGGGEYAVGNNQLDPMNPDYEHSKGGHHPSYSYLRYAEHGKKHAHTYFYDWLRLIEIKTDANTGEAYKYSKIGGSGATFGKTRKIERLRKGAPLSLNGPWETELVVHYNAAGKFVREIDGAGNVTEIVRSEDGPNETWAELVNGVKVRAETLKNGRKTYEMRKIGDDICEAFSLDGSNKTLVKKNGKDLNTYER